MWKLVVFISLTFFHASSQPINETCVLYPNTGGCSSYNLPSSVVDNDISSLCTEMQFMCGCTIEQTCKKSDFASSKYCQDFSILKDLCLDMPGMSGCQNYKSMCSNISIVQECSTDALPLPGTMQTYSLIQSICTSMTMDGCEPCMSDMNSCDLLTTYSNLCKMMPDMKECTQWKSLCVAIPTWPFCATQSNDNPVMRMYFHTGILDYILFYGWVPRTTGQYIGSWIAIFVAGVLMEVLKVIRFQCELSWKAKHASKKIVDEKTTFLREKFKLIRRSPSFDIAVDLPRALLKIIESSWSYLLMLVAMTFNVGLCLAVVFGMGVGTLLFGRFMVYDPEKSSCCE